MWQALHKRTGIPIPFHPWHFAWGFIEQGIYQDDSSISRHTLFFREDDPISIAQEKWLDCITDDYIFIWDICFKQNNIWRITRSRLHKLHDLFEIITFINPQAIQIILNDPKLFELLKIIRIKAIDRQHYVQSRYSAYYAWMIYGWRPLHPDLPSYNSSHFLSQPELNQ